MFRKLPESGTTRSQSIIQEGMVVRGEMKAEGDIRLDGTLEGAVSSKSRVTIGATGVIKADIEADEVLVMGQVQGKVTGQTRIELRKGARVEGDLCTQALVIEEGVFFQGFAQMSSPRPASNPARPSPGGDGKQAAAPESAQSKTVNRLPEIDQQASPR